MPTPFIQIGDDLLDDALLSTVEITQELNQHWWCTVVCRQTEDKRIPLEDFLGKSVQVKTTDQDGGEHVNFSGFILDVELMYEVWGSYTAQFIAVSDSYKSDLATNKQYYAAQTLSSIASTVAGRSGLSVSVDAGSGKPLNYVQYGETDFSFINRIVDNYGGWLRPKEGGIEIYNSFQGGGSVQWRGEDGLLDFRIKGTLSPATFSGSHYDHHAMASNTFTKLGTPAEFYPSAAKLTSAVQSQSQALLPAGFAPQRARTMTLSEYQESLHDESQRSIGGNVTGSGHSRNQQLMAGNTIDIQGTLDGQGMYGLVKVVHRWDRNGYSNSFVCTPWKNYRNPQQPPLRAWHGVVPARVVDHNDPKKMGRLKVQFFWQTDGSTHWARATSPHAGPDRGFMFMPEIGDEVAVIFEDGDPERPIILGSLWNGVQQAPRLGYYGEDIAANDVKRILTKSGNRIQIADVNGNEAITIATPNNTSLTFSEKHTATGRPLVAVTSAGDITLSAPNGRIHFHSLFFSREVGPS